MASEQVGSIHYDLNLDTKEFDKAVSNVNEDVKKLGDRIQDGFRDVAKVMTVVAAGLTVFSKKATDATVDLVKSSKNLGREIGVTTEEASRLTAAFARVGVEVNDARQMFGIFSKNITEATKASKESGLETEKLRVQIEKTKFQIRETQDEIKKNGDKTGELNLKLKELNVTLKTQEQDLNKTANAFQRLGISTIDNTGKQKDFNTILFEVADKFKAMPDGIDKTSLAMELFGRSGRDMIRVLNLGSQGIQDLEKEADRLGLTLNPNTIASIDALVRSQKRLKEQTDSLKIAVGTATAPALTAFNEKINDLVKSMLNLGEPFDKAVIAVLGFGGPVAGATAGVAGFLGNISSIGPAVGKLALSMGLFAVVIGALAAGIYVLNQRGFDWHNLLVQTAATINTVYIPASQLLKGTFDFFRGSLMAVVGSVRESLGPALVSLLISLRQLWQALDPAIIVALKVLAFVIYSLVVANIYIWINAVNFAVKVIAALINFISTLISILGSLTAWLGRVVVSVYNFRDNIVGFFSNSGSWLYNAGRAIVQGLIDGIKSMINAVANAASGVANTVTSKVKNLLGIHSPSKVFQNLGQNVVQGFVEGIAGSSDVAGMAMNRLVGMSLPSAAPVTNNTNNNYNVNADISGMMVRSRTDVRDMARQLIESLNEELRAKGRSEIY